MSTVNGDARHALQAEYHCCDDSASFAEGIAPLPPIHSPEAKTKYISSLRASVTKLQDEVNGFLTRKMEAEKAGPDKNVKRVDEEKAEQNYGEEIMDDTHSS